MERRLRRRKFVMSAYEQYELLRSEIPRMAKLERVLGLTVTNPTGLSCDQQNGIVAYVAGCTVVLYNAKNNRQAHLISNARKTITCLVFSPDGRYVATGESGHEPAVRVWEVETKTQIAELKAHKFGIACVAFSPNLKHLVSVGNHHDMVVNVWNWKTGAKMATNKISCKVLSMSFSASGQYFVTVGVRHVKFWYLERSKGAVAPKYADSAHPLQGRSAILADQRNNLFCDVVCGREELADKTYAITQSGLLCEFNARRLLERWVDLKTNTAASIDIGFGHLFIGCAQGIVRVFDACSLDFVTNLPRPHSLGVDVALGTSPEHLVNHTRNAKYADVVAVRVCDAVRRVTCIYNDRSLYEWDTADLHRVGKISSQLHHCGSVLALELYPANLKTPLFPYNTFLTAGADDTVRVWNCEDSESNENLSSSVVPRTNVYSSWLMKIIYLGQDVQSLCDSENLFNSTNFGDKSTDGGYGPGESKGGIRSIRVSPDGQHLASGAKSGNVRIIDLRTFSIIREHEAHDSDVLCLEYSPPFKVPNLDVCLLATGSRDRLLHVFDASDEDYRPVCTIDDHSSSITALRFATRNYNLMLISCAADKAIIIRVMNSDMTFSRCHLIAAPNTLYDMQIDPLRKTLFAACQDRQIRSFSVLKAKAKKSIKGTLSEEGALLKLCIDRSGTFCASSCSDKSVSVTSLSTGECVAQLLNYSDLVTSLEFSPDCKHLITAVNDSTIQCWRLSAEISKQMHGGVKNENLLTVQQARSDGGSISMEDDGLSLTDSASDTMDENLNNTVPIPKPRAKWIVPELQANNGQLPSEVRDDSTLDESNWSSNLSDAKFGSLANVRLLEENKQTTSDAIIYIPDSPANADSGRNNDDQFQVQERSEVLRRASVGNLTSPYSRSDTFGNEISDDEDSSLNISSSASAYDLHSETIAGRQRKKWGAEPVQNDAIDWSNLQVSGDVLVTPGSADTAWSPTPGRGEQEPFVRGGDRDSLTQRHWKRHSVDTDSSGNSPDHCPPVSALQFSSPRGSSSGYGSGLSTSRSAADISARGRATWQAARFNKQSKSTAAYTRRLADPAQAALDNEIVMRAKSLNQLAKDKQRRLTLPNIYPPDLNQNVPDYNSSELHHRSRSQSPATAMYWRSSRRDSEQSNRSVYSPVGSPITTLPTRAMTPSQSSLGLHPTNRYTPTQQSSTVRRLSDVREKLRKSTENLSMAPETAEVLQSPSAVGALSRSKSYGALSGAQHSSRGGGLMRLAALAKSMGNVHSGGRSLKDSIADLHRVSNPDLSKTPEMPSIQKSPAYYERPSTLPRQRKGAVQKKIESKRVYVHGSVDGGTDSDSASDAGRLYTRRYQHRLTDTTDERRDSLPRTNYLAQKLRNLHETEQQSPETTVILEHLDSRTQNMAHHVNDCLEQLRTSLDKTLQAYQMVQSDEQLASPVREALQTQMLSELEWAQRRLSGTLGVGERTEPEGGHDPSSSSGQEPLPPGLKGGTNLMLEQLSESLVQMIQQKMSKS